MHTLIPFSNGLRLVVVPMRSVRSVTVGVWVGAGSAREDAATNGISHFVEHMLFKGTKTRTAFEIADYVDSIGAQINAFTSKECTCYYTKSVDEHTEKCCQILSDIYFNSVFSDEEMDRERGVVCEEILTVEDTPEELCHDVLASAFFGAHPLARPILGPSENIKSFTREHLQAYMGRFYTADNTVIVMCGNITAQKAEALARKYFVKGFGAAEAQSGGLAAHTPAPSYATRVKDIEQANLAIGFPGFAYNSDESYAVSVLCNILGGCMSSRLFQRIREQLGLCYSVYAYASGYRACGAFNIFTATSPQNAERAVEAIRAELDKLIKDGVTAGEFNRGREQIKSALILAQESTHAVMNAYGKLMTLCGELFDIDGRVRRLNALTADDVNAVIPAVLDYGKACAAYIGKDTGNDVFKVLKA